MDAAKLRLMLAFSGALIGLVGIVAVIVSLVLALVPIMGAVWASLLVGVTCCAIALIMAAICFRPYVPAEEEASDLEEKAAGILADLPFDTAQALIEKHPLTTTTIAAVAGYSLMTNPSGASRHMQKMLLQLL